MRQKGYILMSRVIKTVATLFFLQLTLQNNSYTVMYINQVLTSRMRKENSVFYKVGDIVYSQCTAVLHSPLKTNECFGVVYFLSFGRLGLTSM